MSKSFELVQTMMLNDKIQNLNSLQQVLRKAEDYLNTLAPETPYSEFEHKFRETGLERGWGDTAARVLEMIQLLLDLLEAPDPCTLEKFLGRIPMVFNVVILTPHGYFAQDNVLGYPDTGCQVSSYQNTLLLSLFPPTRLLKYVLFPSRSCTFWIKFVLWRMRCFCASSNKA